jgi:tetratricopeptide (TPR) repeat protein
MTSAFLTLGLLSMQMSEPREAIKHLSAALSRAPAEGLSAIQAHANIAIALASVGRCTEGRSHALSAVRMASVTAPGSQHADAYDILATVELAADRPAQALAAIEEAAAALGSLEGTGIRGSLALHRAQALCMQNEGDLAETWCARAEVLAKENSPLDRIEEQDLTALRARVLEAKGLLRDAMEFALAHVEALSETFSTCALNLVVGRCALALGDHAAALTAVEGVALVGDRLGYVFPDRTLTKSLWELALTCGDSRVIRYAERVLHLQDVGDADDVPWAMSRASCRPGASAPSLSPSEGGMTASEKDLSSPLMYVTTPDGVIRVAQRDIAEVIKSATLVVDTLAHRLRVQDREISLERRRAIEPLVVHLLRRAKDGLSADDVLRAAGGPGPESADAEHRVRVLISRIRHILRDSSAVERVRDAGEYGRTRYRIAASVRFALIEPLHTTN